MDGDGQDDPEYLVDIIKESKKNPERTITINRTKRDDELLFKILYQMYLFLTYLLIKKTDKKLSWVLIPVSAFVFNPLMSSSENFFTAWHSLIPQLAVISVIFLFNKKPVTPTTFVICVILGILASFSSIWGIVIWIAGIFGLINYTAEEKKFAGKKWIFAWVMITIIIGFVYYETAVTVSQDDGLNISLSQIGKTCPKKAHKAET